MGRKSKTPRSEKAATVAVKNRLNLLDKFMGEAPTTPDAQPRSPYASLFVCLLLALAVFAVFGQTANFNFVNYDDEGYVLQNRHIAKGFNAASVAWAFTSFDCTNWHPVTWLSHIADCQLYGLNPGKHHLTNVFIHAFTSILLFLLLRQMTGRFWPSALVAFLFAIHPLRVESVAWISERKDLLCGLFFMLTLMAYVGYARNAFSWLRYAAVILLFSLGLMSKPMIVTLPFVLLLLDYWPLGRASFSPQDRMKQSAKRIIIEKIPLFILAAAACWITMIAQKNAIAYNEHIPLVARIENAAVSYVGYLQLTFLPLNLATVYPYPTERLPWMRVSVAIGVLLTITAVAVIRRKRNPYLLIGWLWFLGTLIPVIGLVQVGVQSMADRYSYLPQIGVLVALVFGATAILKNTRLDKKNSFFFSAACICALSILASVQTCYWRNSETLWNRAIACTKNNYPAYNNYASYLIKANRATEAKELCERSLKIKPDYFEAHFNLGLCYGCLSRPLDAIKEYDKTLQSAPDFVRAIIAKAICENLLDRPQDAVENFKKALRIEPDSFEANYHLGLTLDGTGKSREALPYLAQAILVMPELLDPYLYYIAACDKADRSTEAVPAARQALELARKERRRDSANALENWLAEHDAATMKP